MVGRVELWGLVDTHVMSGIERYVLLVLVLMLVLVQGLCRGCGIEYGMRGRMILGKRRNMVL